jgi:phage terminase large subunit
VVLPANLVQPFEDEIHPLFWANLWATAKVIINQGGSWSGKTECIMRVLFAYAINFPNLVITVATNTIPKLKEDALRIGEQLIAPTYRKMINGQEIELPSKIFPFVVQYHKTDRKIIFSNGSEISFKSFENEEQAKGEKRDILYFVEMTRTTFGIWYELYMRTRIRCFGCYNPTSSFYVHKNILGNKVEFISTLVLRSWHEHNPYLPAEKHAELERITDPIMWKVYARGLTGMLRGTIYPDWVMVDDDDFGDSDGVIWGTDWAFSEDKRADPSANVRVKRNPPKRPDLDYIIDQVAYGQGIGAPDIALAMIAEGYKEGQPDYCDHAVQQVYEKQLNGITGATMAIKGPGSLLAGILFLKRKRIGVTRRSVKLWEEQASYKFLEIEGIVTNTPIDEFNHGMDAARYAIYSDALANGYT